MPDLLSRDAFREAVFARDNHECVHCERPGQDAHHIIERRLWPDGGYYLDNGVTVCGECHLKAEQTVLSCEQLRREAGIKTDLLPPHLSPLDRFDKWGNPYLSSDPDEFGRAPGELFWDESVQKALASGRVLGEFSIPSVKYPRTLHLPGSPGATSDDVMMDDKAYTRLTSAPYVVTEKMDGENTTMTRDTCHARSLDSASHDSQAWVQRLHSVLRWHIPVGWRVCGENMYARHSITYDDLESYFLIFSIWDRVRCLPWDETVEWVDLLHAVLDEMGNYGDPNVGLVPVIQKRGWAEAERTPLEIWQDYAMSGERESEGFVVRARSGFSMAEFQTSVAKYVRADHVRTEQHGWRYGTYERNGLANGPV